MKFATTILLATALGTANAADPAPLSVTLEGVEARGGKLYVSVQTEEEFMENRGTAGDIVDGPDAGTHDFTFDLAPGTYAVSVWHDYNGNGQFDMSDAGMPIDGWAMSGTMPAGEPAFSDTAVVVPAEGKSISLSMSYGGAR
jgi:uncharacterized protein (DUF2141 family)